MLLFVTGWCCLPKLFVVIIHHLDGGKEQMNLMVRRDNQKSFHSPRRLVPSKTKNQEGGKVKGNLVR